MEGKTRSFFWVVLVCGIAAFIFQMIGFVTPGWIIVTVSPEPLDLVIRAEAQIGDDVNFALDGQKDLKPQSQWQHGRPRGRGPHHGPHRPRNGGGPHQGKGPHRNRKGPHRDNADPETRGNGHGMGPGMGQNGHGMGPNSHGMGPGLGPNGNGMNPGMGPNGQGMGPDMRPGMGPNGQGMGPDMRPGMGPNCEEMPCMDSDMMGTADQPMGPGMMSAGSSEQSDESESESRDRPRRQASPEAFSDPEKAQKDLDRGDMWPMGADPGMNSLPNIDEMEGFMEEIENMGEPEPTRVDPDFIRSDLSMFGISDKCGHAMKSLASLTSDSKITLKFGLWFSYICTSHDHDHDHDHDHGRDHDHDHGRTDKHGHSSEQQRPYHKKCRCVKMPSECFFEIHSIVEPSTFVEMKGHEDKTSLYRKLTEHRIEGTMSVVLCLFGVVLGTIAFKVNRGKKWFAISGFTAMFLSALLITLPVIRHAKRTEHIGNDGLLSTHTPYSIICSGLGGLLCFVSMLIIATGVYKNNPKRTKWYRFDNQQVDQVNAEKTPRLVFMNDPFPEKPPMYDVCDLGNFEPTKE